jgi:hypothetical protein
MVAGRNGAMVGAMSPFSRKLLRYGASVAFFACGLSLLAAGWPAGIAWTLIVVSLALAVQWTNAIGPPSDRPSQDGRHGGQHSGRVERRDVADARRTLSGPR